MKSVAIVCKSGVQGPTEMLGEFLKWLKRKGLMAVLDTEAAHALEMEGTDREEVPITSDLIIVFGGDGTMLSVARAAAPYNVPILGVNLGSLGFLTEFYHDELYMAVEEVLDGKSRIERRMMLQNTLIRGGKTVIEQIVLNDAVINKAARAHMINLETSVNGRELTTYRADGLIISTPTGSTAYTLSAGGPILHPNTEGLVLTPICPHTLSNRPLVLPNDAELSVRLASKEHVYVVFDGQIPLPLQEGDVLNIKKSPHFTQVVMPRDRDYFQVLRTKLRWGER